MNSRTVVLTLKTLLITLSLFAALLVGVFFSVPMLLSKQLPGLIEQNTGRKTSLNASLHWSPLTLEVRDFVMYETDGDTFASFDKLSIQIDALQSVKQTALIIDQVTLQKPNIHLARNKKGEFNFQNLSPVQKEAQAANDKAFPVHIGKLSATGGKLLWNDGLETLVWTDTLDNLEIAAENISTHSNQPSHIQLQFSLQSGGNFGLDAAFGANPLSSQGHIKLTHLNLAKFIATFAPDCGIKTISTDNVIEADYQLTFAENKLKLIVPKSLLELHGIEYGQAGKSFKLTGLKHETAFAWNYDGHNWQLEGKSAKIVLDNVRVQDKLLGKLKQLTFDTQYSVHFHDRHLDVNLHEGSVSGKELQVSDQEKNLGLLPGFNVQGLAVNFGNRALKIKSISLENAYLNAWLNHDGTVNVQTLMQSPDTASALSTVTATPISPRWQISADNLALKNCSINFEDRRLPKPATIAIHPVNLKLSNYSNQTSSHWPFELTAGINQNGLLALKGDVSLEPFAATLAVAIKNIELEKFQPYYEPLIRLDIIDGMVNVDGNVTVLQKPAGPIDIVFNGNGNIQDMLIRDQRVHKDFLKWQNLTLKNLSVEVLKQRYTAAELIINHPYARVTIRKDKTINFSNLLITQENPVGTAAIGKKAEAKPPYFKLGKIQIIEGSSDFTDLSLVLPFSAHIKSLDGGASGVSSDKSSQIEVALKGNAYDLAPVDIVGKIRPFLGEYDTKIKFSGLPMPLVSSYMVQFAGYKVEKGKMTVNLDYQIADKKLTASNHFLIDQFELGERLQHPDAVSLPIKLAVELLKDSSGKINIDVPVSGDLDNPQFNIGAIITDALFNSITKIIKSPFSLLASLVGSEESSLDTILFKAGSATLENRERMELDAIATALKTHPKLMLEIKGTTVEGQDWPAISDDALYDQLKIRRSTEINLHTKQKVRAEYVELSKADYQRLLADMFIEKFPLLAEKSLLGIPQLKNPKEGQQFYEVAKQKLQDYLKPEQERLKELANDRAQAIAKFMVQQGNIGQERIYLLDSVVSKDNNKEIASLLSLKAN